jgi:hypothetical protein
MYFHYTSITAALALVLRSLARAAHTGNLICNIDEQSGNIDEQSGSNDLDKGA